MALLKFISLSVGSLLLFQGAYANGENSHTADDADDCVTTMNTARQEVGLPTFATESSKNLTGGNKASALQAICGGLLPSEVESFSEEAEAPTAGTVVYYKQDAKNCSDAVTKWKQGFSAFSSYTSSPPPAFEAATGSVRSTVSQLGAAPYNTEDAVSFAALYSTRDNATAECAFVTCKANSTSRTSQANDVKATVCITYPPALQAEKAPWSEEQWKKILAVFDPSSSSANAAVPTLLALAAAAVGVALM